MAKPGTSRRPTHAIVQPRWKGRFTQAMVSASPTDFSSSRTTRALMVIAEWGSLTGQERTPNAVEDVWPPLAPGLWDGSEDLDGACSVPSWPRWVCGEDGSGGGGAGSLTGVD